MTDNQQPTQGDMAAFGASNTACYLYPGEGQQKERAAFCAGASFAATQPRGDAVERLIARSKHVFRSYDMGRDDAHGEELLRDCIDHLAALQSPQPAPRVDVERAVDLELIERVRYAVEHPDAQGFLLAKAGMTRHDFRRILAALAQSPQAGEETKPVAWLYQTDREEWLSRRDDEAPKADCDFKVIPLYAHSLAQPSLPSEGEG